jgi:dihydroorotase
MMFRRNAVSTLVLALSLTPAAGQQIYDLLLKNGHVIDPQNDRNGRFDIAIVGNKIARVAKNLPVTQARNAVDVSQYYVTPGLIDIHTHFDAQGAWLNLQPDHMALTNGVTTAVDAGGSGWKNFDAFKDKVIDRSKTRLLAFLNIAANGAFSDSDEVDPEAAARIVRKHPEIVVGVSAAGTREDVNRALKAAELSKSILMVAFHSKPGRGYRDVILRQLRPGDIQTHCYSRLMPLLDADQKVEPFVWQARRRGVLFDVGHGAGGFWFRIAAPAVRQKFLPDTISTCISKESILLPRADMMTTMSKFLNMGLTLEQVIDRTTVEPARTIRRAELGTLSEGVIADIAVLELRQGRFGFLDSGHGKLIGDKKLFCVLTVRDGEVVWDTAGLTQPDWKTAGPPSEPYYSNYK